MRNVQNSCKELEEARKVWADSMDYAVCCLYRPLNSLCSVSLVLVLLFF